MADFTIGEYDYRSSPMDAMTQFKIMRRLAPAMAAMADLRNMPAPEMSPDATAEEATAAMDAAQSAGAARMIEVAGKAIGIMDDESTEFIIENCMVLCERRGKASVGGSWARVWSTSRHAPMHTDMNMGIMLQAVVAVLKETFADFFPESLSKLKVG